MEEITCGNCRKECYKMDGVACEKWKGSVEYLESQLARFQPHPFDPEKRETWPEGYKNVLVKLESGLYCAACWHENSKKWWEAKDILILEKVIWWCELPGEEG